jgi:membrane protein implicated in regulation of membrane protease activity
MPFQWFWWLVLALILFLLEIVTTGFVIMWFGVGAIVAAIFQLFGVENIYVLVLIFGIVSIILVIMSRTIFKNIFMRNSPGNNLKSNTETMPEKTGIVTETINNGISQGRVLVEYQDWSARSEDGSIIEKGMPIKVIRIEGVKLIVKIIN